MKFRKKPVVIDAVQWLGPDSVGSVLDLVSVNGVTQAGVTFDGESARIDTLEGTMTASPGDWIIKGIKGEFYPRKPDIFAATYEAVEPDIFAATYEAVE